MNLLSSSRIVARSHQGCTLRHILNVRRNHQAITVLGASIFLLCVWLAAVPAWAGGSSTSSVKKINDSLPAAREFDDPKISPDGRLLAWTSGPDILVKDWRQATSQPQKLAQGSDLAWSPDSRRLAFLADAGNKGQQQLCVVDATGGAIKKLTNLQGALDDPKWSPDGKMLGFLFVENSPRRPGAMEPMEPFVGVVHVQSFEQRVAVVDLASGRVRLVSPSDLYVYEYDWSPDGKAVVGTGAYGPGDDNHYIAQLYTINLESGKATSIYKPDLQITAPRWSPDGKQIAFIGGLMAGFGGGNTGDVWVIPAEGGRAQDLTPEMKASARGPHGSAMAVLHPLASSSVGAWQHRASRNRFDSGQSRATVDRLCGTRFVRRLLCSKRREDVRTDSIFPRASAGDLGRPHRDLEADHERQRGPSPNWGKG